MAVFTIFWAMWAVVSGSAVLAGLGALLFVVGVLLLVLRVQLRNVSASEPDRGRSLVLPIALAVELVAILVTVAVLRAVDSELIQPAVAVIVGLHFLIFQADQRTRDRMHLATSSAGVLIGVSGVVGVAGGAPVGVVHGLVGVGMSLVTISYAARFLGALRT